MDKSVSVELLALLTGFWHPLAQPHYALQTRLMTTIRSLAARVGGLARAAQYDGLEVTAEARRAFIASFELGHSCRVCPEVILPDDLTPSERHRRGEALRRGHYARLAMTRAQKRAARASGG